ncbi:iris-like isoform X2 [Haemaphysalis longicornis]
MGHQSSRHSPTTSAAPGVVTPSKRENTISGTSGRPSSTSIQADGHHFAEGWFEELTPDWEAVLTRSLFQLGINLLHELRRSSTDGGNVLVSPYAVASALEELLAGARGETAQQIASVLHVESPRQANPYFVDRDQRLPTRWRNDVQMRFDMDYLNSVHHDKFLATVDTSTEKAALRLERFSWDFAGDAERSRADIDGFARLGSNAFEPDEIMPKGSITSSSLVCLLSLLDFRGSWSHAFDDRTASHHPFYETADAPPTAVVMLHQTGHFRVATCSDLHATALEIPYQPPGHGTECIPFCTATQSGCSSASFSRMSSPPSDTQTPTSHPIGGPELSLVILLPLDRDGLSTLEERLTSYTALRCLSMLKHHGVVHVTELTSALSALGVRDVFSDRAELWGSTAGQKRVSSIRHAAAFQTSPTGGRHRHHHGLHPPSVAAKLPHCLVSLVKAPHPSIHFTVDRPFAFFVVCMHPDTLLLLGSVRKITW